MKTAVTWQTQTAIINEIHLGTDATPEDARRMVGALQDMGYDVEYGADHLNMNEIADEDWQQAMETLCWSK